MNKIRYFILFLILAGILSVTSEAAQVDFGWSTPEFLFRKDESGVEKRYLFWVYSIKNTIDQKITVPVAAFLTTDTEKNYAAKYIPEIAAKVSEGEEVYISSDEMKGEYNPGEIRNGIAIFEDIDPYAQKINIFMTGLSHFFFWRWRLVDYSYKITYKKSGEKWTLEEHGFSKDNSHRDFTDKFKGSFPD